jgi:hypothetical protein
MFDSYLRCVNPARQRIVGITLELAGRQYLCNLTTSYVLFRFSDLLGSMFVREYVCKLQQWNTELTRL